jgi:hypothetical protein
MPKEKNMKSVLIISIVAFLILTGCSNVNVNENENNASIFTPETTIDFENYKNDYITDDILNTLKENLQAINDKNKDQFVKGFIPGNEQGNLFWIEGNRQYHFHEIAATQQEGKRINITIYYQYKENEIVDDNSMTYTFVQDSSNNWRIAIID